MQASSFKGVVCMCVKSCGDDDEVGLEGAEGCKHLGHHLASPRCRARAQPHGHVAHDGPRVHIGRGTLRAAAARVEDGDRPVVHLFAGGRIDTVAVDRRKEDALLVIGAEPRLIRHSARTHLPCASQACITSARGGMKGGVCGFLGCAPTVPAGVSTDSVQVVGSTACTHASVPLP